MTDQTPDCAVCGKPCQWVAAREADRESANPIGGWHCKPCDAFTETDVEVED